METDVCQRFNPLTLNPFQLPNMLHTNNDDLVLLLIKPMLLFQIVLTHPHTPTHTHFQTDI